MNESNTNTAINQLSLGLIITVIQDVLKRWRIIVAASLIAAMIAFVFTDLTYRPQYQTMTTFVVSSANTSSTPYSNLSAANTTASVFTQVLNSSLLRQKVAQEVGLTEFDGTITAEVAGDTNILTMIVTGSDPRSVFLMSNAIIHHHHLVSGNILRGTILEVLKEPVVPTYPVNPPATGALAKKAALLSAAGVAVLLAVMAVMADKIHSREEADIKLGCHVLGELYHERKCKTLKAWLSGKKKSILITNPLTSFVYTESVHKLSSRIDKRRHNGEHVIMITSLLENEGKSTVAVNLALSMARKGKKTLLVDCDLRKPACSKILGGSKESAGVIDVLWGRAPLHDCVKHLKNSGLDLLPGKKSLKAATNLVNSPAMGRLLKEAAKSYDIVIVDTPPMALAPDAECICEFADAALLVVRQNAATANDLNDAAALLGKSTHLLGCVLNNVYGSGNFSPVFRYGSYGKYDKYDKYGRYGKYGYGSRE